MAFTDDSLSIELYFDLDNDRYRLKDVSDYVSEGIAESNIRGVYTLTDPNGIDLNTAGSYSSPDVATSINADLYSVYKTFTVVAGVYTIDYYVYDSDTTTTYTKTFTFTYAATDIPDVVISVESDVALATIQSTDETVYTSTITLDSRTHVLTYPDAWGSTTETSVDVDTIALTYLYTGEYTATISSTITNSKADDLIITKTITGTQTHDVWDSDGFYTIKDALNNYYTSWQTNQTANPKEGRNQEYIWTKICANYTLYNSYKQNGDITNSGEYLNNIKEILEAEGIDTDIDPSVSVPVTATLPGYATRWLYDSGAPSASIGRPSDYYVDTSTNIYYNKTGGSWVVIGTLGSNVLIEFSADGSTGWTETYANGLNYIRFSGDGGTTYTDASKFIDGYTYIAYASDDSGTDFICTDDPSFIADNSLEYRAEKKFQSSHNGDLVAGDFSGLFVRYKGEGISASVSNIEVPYDPNTTTYDYTNAQAQIILRRAGDDLTTDFSYTKNAESNVTATVGASTGLVTITDMTSTIGYVDVTASKSGVVDIFIRIYVIRIENGEHANSIFSSISSVSLSADANGNNIVYPDGNDRPMIYVFEGNSNETSNWSFSVSDESNISALIEDDNAVQLSGMQENTAYVTITATRSGYDDLTISIYAHKTNAGRAIVDSSSADAETIELADDYQLEGNSLAISNIVNTDTDVLSTTRIVMVDYDLDVLRAYDWDGTDWSLTGSELSFSGDEPFSVAALSSSRVAVACRVINELRIYDFDGSNWTQIGNSYNITLSEPALCKLTSSSFAYVDSQTDDLRVYSFDGTNIYQDGNSYDLGSVSAVTLARLDSSTVALGDAAGLSRYSWDGTNWSLTGSKLTGVSIIQHSMDALSSSVVVTFSASSQKFQNYEYNAGVWQTKDTPYSAPSNDFYGITCFDSNLIAVFDCGANDLQTYKFGGRVLRVKDEGITAEKLATSGKTSIKMYTGALSLTPTDAEITAILGDAFTYSNEFMCVIQATSGTGTGFNYLITKYADFWLYLQTSLAT